MEDEIIEEKIEKNRIDIEKNIKILRNNLECIGKNNTSKIILVTSPTHKEGKSFISSKLAIEYAKSNKKTLLIDFDIKDGRQEIIFKIGNDVGLNEIIKYKDIENFKGYIKDPKIENLGIFNRGNYDDNSSELLTSKDFYELLKLLKKSYDIIIIDGTPVNTNAETLIISKNVDQIVMVCRIDKTTMDDLKEAEKALKTINVGITGIVLNDIPNKEWYTLKNFFKSFFKY